MFDLMVVGAGIFGSVVGRHAQSLGLKVQWVDSGDPRAASPASAGLFKPSWLTALSKEDITRGMDLIDGLAPMRSVTLNMQPSGLPVHLKQVSPTRLMVDRTKVLHAKVSAVRPGEVDVVTATGTQTHQARFVIVAAGVGCNDIETPEYTPYKHVVGKAGVAFAWQRREGYDDNRMHLWAPYKQTMVFHHGDNVMWGGDGTALKELTKERMTECANRVGKLAQWSNGPRTPTVSRITGVRPLVEGHKAGGCWEVGDGLWQITGGGKIGTVAAGVHALEWAKQAGVA